MLEAALAYNKANRDAHIERLKDLVRIPSIGVLPAYNADTVRCAEAFAAELKSIGLNNVEIIKGNPVDEQPLVKGEWMGAPGKPVILLYGHYDVQPADPLNEWTSPPFDPVIRDGKLYGRGSSDDKGELWAILKSVEAYLKTGNTMPVNVKVLIEGQEEYTSAHVKRFVDSRHDWLKDVASVFVLDSVWFAKSLPSIQAGLRGLITADVTVRGTKTDLHSGKYGGAAPNAAQALCEIIARLKTPGGRIRIPGIYKDVRKPPKAESDSWKKLPFSEAEFLKEIGAKCTIGDKRYSILHRIWALPTLEVCGMWSGFTGDGFKTVIPAVAHAKISMRLAAGMDDVKTADMLVAAIKAATPACVDSEVRIITHSPAVIVDVGTKPVLEFVQAYKDTLGSEVAFTRMGGSIPVCDAFSKLGVPLVISGIGSPDGNHHAPNEFLDLSMFNAGLDAVTRYLYLLGQ